MHSIRMHLVAVSFASALTAQGVWLNPFPHDLTGFPALNPTDGFNAIHMCMIPAGPNRGAVLVMDREFNQPSGAWKQRYAIVDVSDPALPTFDNHELTLPFGEGDLFCSGHTWDARGRLFVAGGTTEYLNGAGTLWKGGRLAMWFDPQLPAANAWSLHQSPYMNKGRWYPTVTLTAGGHLLVFGGTEYTPTGGPATNGLLHDYEVHDGNQWRVFPGPPLLAGEQGFDYYLGLYPRIHVLKSGRLFTAAHSPRSRRLTFPGGQWQNMDALTQTTRGGSSVLFPNIPGFGDHDVVMVIGGKQGGSAGTVTDRVHYCSADAPAAGGFPTGWDWQLWPDMAHVRWRANATILPDASILVVGGDRNPDPMNPNPVLEPELFRIRPDGTSPTWIPQPPQAGPRTYHSTAVLLPDARVLIGGGDTRSTDPTGSWRYDYQIYEPDYLHAGLARPAITSTPQIIRYGQPFTLQVGPVPVGQQLDKVVLIRPGTATHHTDYDQRYRSLEIVSQQPNSIDCVAPASAPFAPPGHYMVFLVTDKGIPSVAGWTYLY